MQIEKDYGNVMVIKNYHCPYNYISTVIILKTSVIYKPSRSQRIKNKRRK